MQRLPGEVFMCGFARNAEIPKTYRLRQKESSGYYRSEPFCLQRFNYFAAILESKHETVVLNLGLPILNGCFKDAKTVLFVKYHRHILTLFVRKDRVFSLFKYTINDEEYCLSRILLLQLVFYEVDNEKEKE